MWSKILSILAGAFTKRSLPKEDKEEQPAKPTIRTTDKKITIVIDPGHGGSDPGAVYPKDKPKYKEANLVLSICGVLVRMLDSAGHKVYLTRADNTSPLTTNERIKRIKAAKGDLLVSVHCNSFHKDAYGIETLFNSSNSKSKQLAECIQRSMMKEFSDHKDRGVKERNRLYVLKTMSPSCLVEVEFINTAGAFIVSKKKEIAEAIFQGIQDFIES